ncbi:MAG: hypothetical protein NZ770_01190, partial [Candidatus Poseidoniaceae archaeon]|nr:hypothetical protein [Candidatus Poseidoniaceae archaeon]
MSDIPMIGQMSITDEHKLIPAKTKMKGILSILREEPSTAVILHDGNKKKMKIVGVITAEEIDSAVNDGKNPKKLKIEDVALTNILEIPSDVPVSRAIEVIQEKGPDAVIVRHRDGDFAGYFSVDDFHEAKDLVGQQQERAQQFQQNTQAAMNNDELQQELEEDDDDSYIPEAMRGLPLSPQMKSTFKAQAQGDSAKPSEKPRGPPGRPRGPPGQTSEPEPEPEPEPVAPAPSGPSRGGPSRPGDGPPDRPPSSGGVTNVGDGGAMADVGGHLQVEATGAAPGPKPVGDVQRAGPGDPIIDLDIGGAASGPASTLSADERACPYCGETIKAAAKKCRFCMEWL